MESVWHKEIELLFGLVERTRRVEEGIALETSLLPLWPNPLGADILSFCCPKEMKRITA